MKRIGLILCVLIITTLFPGEAFAQARSFGATFSYAGTGVEYVHSESERHFTRYQLRLETSSLFWTDRGRPGISVSAFWNTVFATYESRNGNKVRFYAGPGISAGFSEDLMGPPGMFIGLKGDIGAECYFSRGIAISLSLSPMFGGHFRRMDGMTHMRIYRAGLCYGFMPEAGIRYIF